MLIEAAPGLGKSSLLEAAAERACGSGMTVLRARGSEHERTLPFGGVLQLFEALLRRGSPAEQRRLLAGSAGLAGPLFDVPTVEPSLPDESQALAIIHGLYWLTANLCVSAAGRGARPLALLIDDAHLLDGVSLRFLRYLTGRLRQLPAALLVALRPADPGAPSEFAALRAEHAVVLTPAALSVDAVARLLHEAFARASVAPQFTQAAAQATGGNPFLLRELANELRSQRVEPSAEQAGRVGEIAPTAVLRAVVARLTALPPAAQAIAKALAILGEGAELRHVCRLAGVAPEGATAAVDGLATIGILRSEEPLRFAHPLIASAFAADLPTAWRAAKELEAAELLAAEGMPPERLAIHLQRAPAGASQWVVDVLERAAAHARARGASEIAATLLSRALAEPPASEDRARVLTSLAEAEAAAGLADAATHLRQAIELTDHPVMRAELLGALGRMLAANGHHHDAVGLFREGLALIGAGHRRLARELRAGLASVVASSEGSIEALAAEVAQLADLPEESEPASQCEALSLAAAQMALAGAPVARFKPLVLRAIKAPVLAEAISRDGGLTLTPAAVALLYADELELSLELLETAARQAREAGSVPALATVCYLRAWPLYFTGAIADAIADAQQALLARGRGWGLHAGPAAAILAHARVEAGDLNGARATLREVESFDLPEDHWAWALLLVARARVRLLERDPAGALSSLGECAERLEWQGVSDRPIPWRGQAALATLALGDAAQAKKLAHEERERAEQIGAARTVGMALRVCGLVEERSRGVSYLRAATDALEESPARLEYARALIDLGAASRRAGERVASREPLLRGLELAERFGADLLIRQARAELRAAGAKPRRAALSGIEALTSSEERTARLAAQGLTNREIAQQLFVTIKAVEYHLRHVFQKLDVTSRGELAAAFGGREALTEGSHRGGDAAALGAT